MNRLILIFVFAILRTPLPAACNGTEQLGEAQKAHSNDNQPDTQHDDRSGAGSTQGSQSTTTQTTGNNQSEDNDLDRIPAAPVPQAKSRQEAPADGAANGRIYLENAFIVTARRGGLIVPAPQRTAPNSWQERLFLDVRKVFRMDERLNFSLSDRLNLRAQNDISLPNHENVINDFREAFFSWQPHDGVYLDVGKINLRSGAAIGFNPTDFFRSRAVVEPLTADPSVLREDRLGTLMLEAQYIGHGRALTLAVAPALVPPSPIYTDKNLLSFNPSIDRTNAHDRILVKGSLTIGKDFNPELLYYREGSQNKFGANLTRGFGQKTIGYLEWAGGETTNLIDEALRFGRETGTLPADAPSAIPDDTNVRLQNDLSAGASYTTSSKITFNLEYHLHQGGFSRNDWSHFFSAGQGKSSSSPIIGELFYIRDYALDQQVPLARQSAFLRANWVDAIIPNLELNGFINTDLYDGSSLVQVSADYYLSRAWTIGAQTNANLGSKRSDFGSLPQSAGTLFKLARYF
jgi:hypothetical protein